MYQDNWRWCSQCQALFFSGRGLARMPSHGQCAKQVLIHGHYSDNGEYGHLIGRDSANYTLPMNERLSVGQNGWRWCKWCEALFYSGGAGRAGRCPRVGIHDGQDSADYTLLYGDSNRAGQSNWRHCVKCECLFFNGNDGGFCPAGGHHDAGLSANYSLQWEPTVFPIMANYLVTWQSFNGALQDDCDQIQVNRYDASVPVTRFILSTSNEVNFVKELKFWSPSHPPQILHTEGDHHGPSLSIDVPNFNLEGATIILSKGKGLNILQPMYQLSSLAGIQSKLIQFTWRRDHC